jgi:hypothetical protein
MSHHARRILLVLTALLSLSLPLAAQTQSDRQSDRQADRREPRGERFLSLIWERLTAPLAALGIGGPDAADPASPGTVPPPVLPDPGNGTDGRSILDPLG